MGNVVCKPMAALHVQLVLTSFTAATGHSDSSIAAEYDSEVLILYLSI